jgi:hypothetical protein
MGEGKTPTATAPSSGAPAGDTTGANTAAASSSGATAAPTSESKPDAPASEPNPDGGNGNVSLAHLENVQKAVQDLTNIFQVNIINAVIRKFYADTYKVYRDIVTAYKQQTNTQQQPAEKQAETPAETPAEKTQAQPT